MATFHLKVASLQPLLWMEIGMQTGQGKSKKISRLPSWSQVGLKAESSALFIVSRLLSCLRAQ